MPALLVWGFWLCTSPLARGAAVALSGWTKFAALLLAPLWLTYPTASAARTALQVRRAASSVATLAVFSILLLEPSLTDAIATFVDRTFGYQLGRDSPFSPWDWGQYHARGIPDLHAVQIVLRSRCSRSRSSSPCSRARKAPLELAALTAALLVGFELVLTHWSYLYIPWFLPFVLLALFLPPRRRAGAQSRCRAPCSLVGSMTSRVVVLVVAACAALLVGVFVADLEGDARDHGHPGLPELRRAIEDGERALPRLPRRVSARGARAVRLPVARHATPTATTRAFQALMILSLAALALLIVLSLVALRSVDRARIALCARLRSGAAWSCSGRSC